MEELEMDNKAAPVEDSRQAAKEEDMARQAMEDKDMVDTDPQVVQAVKIRQAEAEAGLRAAVEVRRDRPLWPACRSHQCDRIDKEHRGRDHHHLLHQEELARRKQLPMMG